MQCKATQFELPFKELEKKPVPTPVVQHYAEPKNDNERLLEYQYKYIKQGEQQALTDMYLLGYQICRKYINTEARRNKHIRFLDDGEKEEKAHNAITYVIARYKSVDGFHISRSFTGYLFLRIQHELYYHRKIDTQIDFVDWL